MKEPHVYVVADNILSPLGATTADNFLKLKQDSSGVKQHHNVDIGERSFYASLFDSDEQFISEASHTCTKFEQLLITSIGNALMGTGLRIDNKKTILIISTTKGNISLLETEVYDAALKKRIALSGSAKLVSSYFKYVNHPIVISNACISGSLAIITAMRLLRSGQYENAVVAGADVISKFIFSGFESFQALSTKMCKPFDKSRDGLNLGEGAGTIILSTDKKYRENIRVKGGSVSNDANHISGPSRTGKELAYAINQAILDAKVPSSEISFISAHGTATVYNDEMEANAINLAGFQQVPVNSLKGYYGHTLGASGLIESIVSVHSLLNGEVLPTMGFEQTGVTNPVNVTNDTIQIKGNNFLKTASGFGGCNAAVVFGR